MNLAEFPKSSGKFSNLESLDLSNNKLSGRVPNWLLETVNSLTFLNLSQNLFTSINQFSRDKYQLRVLDLSFNQLEGDLPESICRMSALEMLNLAHNKLTGIIPQCVANIASLQVLDLQMNRFYGPLPSNYTESSDLHTLNLYGNKLEGRIPKSWSRTNLQFINLGSNKIEDNFPFWFEPLQFLRVLVLRDNKLHGEIPNQNNSHPFPRLIIFDISGNDFSGLLPKAYLEKFEAMKSVTQVTYLDNNIDTATTFQTYYDSTNVTAKGLKMSLARIPKFSFDPKPIKHFSLCCCLFLF